MNFMISRKNFLNKIPHLFLRFVKIIVIFIGVCVAFIMIILLPVAFDTAHNEIRLVIFKEHVKQYPHPVDSQLWERISLSGNFGRASNQCGFIVAEVRTTMLKPDAIHKFYMPILTDISFEGKYPYKNITLYALNDKKNIENIKLYYPDVYERIAYTAMTDPDAYILIFAETGYPPNFDPRCH